MHPETRQRLATLLGITLGVAELLHLNYALPPEAEELVATMISTTAAAFDALERAA